MSFEHVALSVVTDVARHAKAEFVNGTLFVSGVDAFDATRILNNLRQYVYADTIINRITVADEYAYDFC